MTVRYHESDALPLPTRIGAWLTRPVDPDDIWASGSFPHSSREVFLRSYFAHLPHAARVAPPTQIGGQACCEDPAITEIAPLAVASLRRHLNNRITRVVAATPARNWARWVASFLAAEVIADEDLLPEELRHLIRAVAPAGREAGSLNQFLSLNYAY